MAIEHTKVRGEVKSGYGVASGKRKDERYPQGTLKQQLSHFLERGLDLSQFYLGTINVDIAPCTFEIKQPKHFFKEISWSEFIPPENFYFFDVSLHYKGNTYTGLVYMPDPETKEDHIQKPSLLELLLPKIDGLGYGQTVELEVQTSQLRIIPYATEKD